MVDVLIGLRPITGDGNMKVYIETERDGVLYAREFKVRGGLGRIHTRLWMVDSARLTCEDGTMYEWRDKELHRVN